MTGRVFCFGNGEAIKGKMQRLVATIEEQFAERQRLEAEIRDMLRGLRHAP